MTSLRATTLLGDNTIPLLAELVERLGQIGVIVDFDPEQPADERERDVRSGTIDLVFACGLLTMEMIRDGVPLEVVAVPVFPGETEPVYRSVVIVRNDSPARTIADVMPMRLAVNEYGSWSGWRAWERHLGVLGHSADEHPTQIVSGGHTRSIDAVRTGIADVAAIDSSIWHWVEPAARGGLRVLDQTQDWPAPPLSCVRSMPEELRARVVDTVTAGERWAADDGSVHRVMIDGSADTLD